VLTLAAIVAVDLAFVLALAAFLRPWLTPLGTAVGEAVGLTVPPVVGWGVLVPAVLIAFVVAQVQYARRAALDAAGVDPDAGVPGDVHARVTRLAAAFDIPVPQVVSVETPVANAFTVDGVGDATLVVSTGLVETLSRAELDAVLAHELAHVRNRDAAVVTLAAFLPALVSDGYSVRRDLLPFGRLGGTVTLLGVAGLLVAGGSLVPGITPGGALVALGLASVVGAVFVGVLAAPVVILGRRLTKTRELIADRAGALATGDPAAMASVIRRLDDRARHPRAGDARARPVGPDTADDGRPAQLVRALCFLPNGFDRSAGPVVADDPSAGPVASTSPFDIVAHPPVEERLARLRELTDEVVGH
jgi:heat shock protein HtpX